MAKKKKKSLNKSKSNNPTPKKKKMTTGDYVALGVFVALAIVIIGFTSHYFFFYKPAVEEKVTAKGEEFVYRFQDVDYSTFEIEPILELLTPTFRSNAQPQLEGFKSDYKVEEHIATAKGIEAELMNLSSDSAEVRVVHFWEVEQSLAGTDAIWTYFDLVFDKVEMQNDEGEAETKWLITKMVWPSDRQARELNEEKDKPIMNLVSEYVSDELEYDADKAEKEIVKRSYDYAEVRVVMGQEIKEFNVIKTDNKWEIQEVKSASQDVVDELAYIESQKQQLEDISLSFVDKYWTIASHEEFSHESVKELISEDGMDNLGWIIEQRMEDIIEDETKAEVIESMIAELHLDDEVAQVTTIFHLNRDNNKQWRGMKLHFEKVDDSWMINDFTNLYTSQVEEIREAIED
ncbi:hypothetical protein PRVXH_001979 [Proteinivorax hydrogeniformans]|uniref:Uncharacterized protein n=1 Tax=Proteinivorax hydrogeniformans TaxID=1826727 RepID=A0AAU8HRL6_9FIRM